MEKLYGDGRFREFILETCKVKGLSLRKLSFNSGLSPGTVYGIINRKYQPTLYSLNRLADYLGVKREYLWKLADLIEDDNFESSDIRLKSQFLRVNDLPDNIKDHVVATIEQTILLAEKVIHKHS